MTHVWLSIHRYIVKCKTYVELHLRQRKRVKERDCVTKSAWEKERVRKIARDREEGRERVCEREREKEREKQRDQRGSARKRESLALHPCSPTRASPKTTVTRILPLISIDVIVVLSVA